MRKSKDVNFWIQYSFAIENGDVIKRSVICDSYNEVLGNVVTETYDYFHSGVISSHIIPSKLIDKIILYDKDGKTVDFIEFRK